MVKIESDRVLGLVIGLSAPTHYYHACSFPEAVIVFYLNTVKMVLQSNTYITIILRKNKRISDSVVFFFQSIEEPEDKGSRAAQLLVRIEHKDVVEPRIEIGILILDRRVKQLSVGEDQNIGVGVVRSDARNIVDRPDAVNLIHSEEDILELFLEACNLFLVLTHDHSLSAKEKLLLQKREIVEQELA